MRTESKILSTEIFNLAAGTSDRKSIQIDGTYDFRIDDIVAKITDANALITIIYNGDKYLVNATYISNVCNISGNGGPLKKISPITLNSNSAIIVEIENRSAAVNDIQVSFIGKKIYK